MAEHLLQRFAAMGSGTSVTTAGPSSPVPSSMATLTQRVHHESPFIRYPVYGPGSGPDVYDDGTGEYWQGESGPGGAFGGGGGPPHPPFGGPPGGPYGGPPGSFGGPPGPPPGPQAPFPYRMPFAKFGKARFKGASVAVLTFIGFLFFLSVLQNYIRDYSTGANSPMVIVLSSGATKENLPQYSSFLQKNDGHLPLSEEEDDGYSQIYSNSKKAPKDQGSNKRHKNHKRYHSGSSGNKDAVSMPPPFSDLLNVDVLKKK